MLGKMDHEQWIRTCSQPSSSSAYGPYTITLHDIFGRHSYFFCQQPSVSVADSLYTNLRLSYQSLRPVLELPRGVLLPVAFFQVAFSAPATTAAQTPAPAKLAYVAQTP